MTRLRARVWRLWPTAAIAVALAGTGCAPTGVSSADPPGPVAEVLVGPSADNLLVGDSQQLIALPRDAKGRAMTGREISWTSLNPELATVSTTGVVSGLAPGTARIIATTEGKRGTSVMTVWEARKDTAECDAPKPGWIWCDDFEKDRLGSYFEYAPIDGSFVRLPGAGYGGSVGMRARFSRRGQVQAGSLKLAFGKTPSPYFRPVDDGTVRYREIYWRHLIKFQAGWVGAGGNKMSRAQVLVNNNWAQAMMAHVWSGVITEGQPYRLGLTPASGTDEAGTVRTIEYNDFARFRWPWGTAWSRTPIFDQMHVGKWYCIEAHARLNDPGRANGVFELWINGAPEARFDRLNWQGSYSEYGINTVFLENYWNDGTPQPQERYFDNFIVSTQRIGC
jgi:Bacterial Ig-like domain (group 2)